jgi:putative FmdB family regulatory protein
MPIYEYECRSCGHHFERIQKFSDAPVTECPECHNAVHRLMSPPAILFNAPGFYATDSKNGKSGARDKGEDTDKKESPKAATCKMCA